MPVGCFDRDILNNVPAFADLADLKTEDVSKRTARLTAAQDELGVRHVSLCSCHGTPIGSKLGR